jgi:hypothetical protein
LTELLVVIGALVLLALVVLPTLNRHHGGPQRIACINNLKEVFLAFQIWCRDNDDKFPMQLAVTNDAMMKFISSGSAYVLWQTLSNELNTPKILVCPQDKQHSAATNFGAAFSDANISYFLNLDANKSDPQALLVGDDNFAVGGVPVKSGLLELSTNSSIVWTSGRHVSVHAHFWTPALQKYIGNVALTDGSVQRLSSRQLQQAIQNSNIVTNRWVIP